MVAELKRIKKILKKKNECNKIYKSAQAYNIGNNKIIKTILTLARFEIGYARTHS